MMGIPVSVSTDFFCDNYAVVKNTTIPELVLCVTVNCSVDDVVEVDGMHCWNVLV
jgi:hypothetical protein